MDTSASGPNVAGSVAIRPTGGGISGPLLFSTIVAALGDCSSGSIPR